MLWEAGKGMGKGLDRDESKQLDRKQVWATGRT